MTTDATIREHSAGAETALAALVDDLLSRLRAGENFDADQILADHPQFASRLRDILPGLRAMCELTTDKDVDRTPDAGDVSGANDVLAGVLGDFRILREIGRGGMGIVYEAIQTSLNRRVALKVLPLAAMLDPRHLQRFKNEAMAAASLDHPNIVEVHAVGCERGVHFYAMRYVEGQTLSAVIEGLKCGVPAPADRLHAECGMNDGTSTTNSAEAPNSEPGTPSSADTVAAALSTLRTERPRDFFRVVAELGIQAAEALDHAHQLGIVHRDIKPSNLMVESVVSGQLSVASDSQRTTDNGQRTNPKLYITDFGLARIESDATLTMTGDLLGTLRYMSPEQAEGRTAILDHRTDIYSLGITLYELLTLRPAFPAEDRQTLLRQIVNDEPLLPRKLNSAIPADLETIVLKSTAKEPRSRYSSAANLADDLRRFVDQQPLKARRPSIFDRGRRWVSRHAALVGVLTVSVFIAASILVPGAFYVASVAENEAALTKNQERVLRADRAISFPRSAGDRDRSLAELALIEGHEYRRQAQTIAIRAFSIFDAVPRKIFSNLRVIDAAWRTNGSDLLLDTGTETLRWNSKSDNLERLTDSATGPIALRGDSIPVQMRVTKSGTIELVDLESKASSKHLSLPKEHSLAAHRLVALAEDASAATALATNWKGEGAVVVWDCTTGAIVHSFPVDLEQITSVTLCPKLVATGRRDGAIDVWSLASGSKVVTVGHSSNDISCLHFAKDYMRPRPSPVAAPSDDRDFLLAAGDEGGAAVVWDLRKAIPRMMCFGGEFQVTSVRLSRDASTLIVASRGVTQVWDTATGRHLLDIHPTVADSVFLSPDGLMLLVCNDQAREAQLWDISRGRGVQLLRGLRGQIPRVTWSADGQVLAAVSHDWTVGVWDLNGGLKHVISISKGISADNVAIVLNGNGTLLAVCGGTRAELWDLTSGSRKESWALPSGIVDLLAFPSAEKLLLVRAEKVAGEFVVTIRNLLLPDPLAPIAEIRDFPQRLFTGALASDGSAFVLDGLESSSPWRRSIRSFDLEGHRLFTIRSSKTDQWGSAVLDSTGSIIAVQAENGNEWIVVETRNGQFIRRHSGELRAMALGGRLALKGKGRVVPNEAVSLYQDGTAEPLAEFDLARHVSGPPAFAWSRNAQLVGWGNREGGSVTIVDLPAVQRQLAPLQLGW